MGKRLRTFFSHPLFLCCLSFFCCFTLGLLLSFPLSPFVQQLERLARHQGIELDVLNAETVFPPGVVAEQLAVSSPALPHPPLRITELIAKPLWATLAGENPGIKYQFAFWQGEVRGEAFKNGGLSANFSNLEIDEPLGSELPLRLNATLEAGKLNAKVPLLNNNPSQLQLQLTNMQVSGLQALGSENDLLILGDLRCSVRGKGPSLKVETLIIKGPSFELEANGILRLAPDPARSIVNLNVTLAPKAGADPWLQDMLILLPAVKQTDGNFRFRLRGNLASVRVI